MQRIFALLPLLLLLSLSPCSAQPVAETEIIAKEADRIVRKEDIPYPLVFMLPSEAFHGEAYLTPLIRKDGTYNTPDANILVFAPGSRSDWHAHGGMLVVGLAGIGYCQIEGESATVIRKGDIVRIPSGVRHWHGAAEDSWFAQIVIYDSAPETVTYQPVTDEEYDHLEKHECQSPTEGSVLTFAKPEEPISSPAFSGPAYVSLLWDEDNPASCPPAFNVVFGKGVYNSWHSHPGGQILIATDGIIYHQIEGQPAEVLHPGEIAFCPPGAVHWHGGGRNGESAHIAIECNPGRGDVVWKGRISQKEYDALPEN